MFIFFLFLVLIYDKNEFVTGLLAILSLLFINCLKIKIHISIYSFFFIFSLIFTFIFNFSVVLLSSLYFFLFLLYLIDYNFKDNTKFLVTPIVLIYILVAFQFLTFFEIIHYNYFNNLIGTGREMYDYTGQAFSDRRAYGLFGNPNYAGFVIIFLYYLCLQMKNTTGILFHFYVLCGLITTGSRAVILSFLIIIFFNFFKKDFKFKIKFLFTIFLLTSLTLINFFDLRILHFDNLTQDTSFATRIKHILIYISDISQNKELYKFLFGNGLRDNLTYYFDGDLGNIFYSFGILGMISFFLLIYYKFRKINAADFFYALLPIFFAGGVFGNYKTLFFFCFFPCIDYFLQK